MKQLALVGCAHIHTPGFVKRLQAREDVTVTTVWDHEFARADKWANETGAQKVNDVRSIWSDDQIDGVIICSETDRHQPLSRRCPCHGQRD